MKVFSIMSAAWLLLLGATVPVHTSDDTEIVPHGHAHDESVSRQDADDADSTDGESAPSEDQLADPVKLRLYGPRSKMQKGYFAEADSLCRAAIAKFEEKYGPESMAVVEGVNLLLEIMWRSNDTAGKDGRVWGDRAIAIAEHQTGERSPELATVLNNYGAFLHADGDYEPAEAMYLRCLDIREEFAGPEATSVARVLNNLGTLYAATNRFQESEQAQRRVIDILVQHFGNRYRDLATSYNNLATAIGRQGRLEEAVVYFEKALALREEHEGATNISVARVLFNLGGLNFELGRTDVAREQFERAVEIQIEFFGEDNVVCAPGLQNLANLYAATGSYDEARDRLEQVVTIYEIHAPGSRELAESVNNLGRLMWKAGWREEATQNLEYAHALRSALLPEGDPDLDAPLANFPWMRLTRAGARASLALESELEAFVLGVPVAGGVDDVRIRVLDDRDHVIVERNLRGERASRPMVFVAVETAELEAGVYHVRVDGAPAEAAAFTFELRTARDAG